MKAAIVINGEEMFSGEVTEWLILMPKNGKLEIALTANAPVARNRSARVARSSHAAKAKNAKS